MLNLYIKRGYDIKLFEEALQLLFEEKPLPAKYLDHPLVNLWMWRKKNFLKKQES